MTRVSDVDPGEPLDSGGEMIVGGGPVDLWLLEIPLALGDLN